MTQKLPERIWVVFEPHRSGKGPPYVHASASKTKGHSFIRENHALALVAAEREAVARWHDEAAQHDQRGLDYSDAVGIPISNAVELSESVKFHRQSAASIRARTNNDAQAALERVKEEARNEALREAADAVHYECWTDGNQDQVTPRQATTSLAIRAIKDLITEDQNDD
jgi:hypothetical protein